MNSDVKITIVKPDLNSCGALLAELALCAGVRAVCLTLHNFKQGRLELSLDLPQQQGRASRWC